MEQKIPPKLFAGMDASLILQIRYKVSPCSYSQDDITLFILGVLSLQFVQNFFSLENKFGKILYFMIAFQRIDLLKKIMITNIDIDS